MMPADHCHPVMNDPALAFDPVLHQYRLGDVVLPSVTRILAEAGVSNFSADWFNEAAKARGRAVHLAIAYDVAGELDHDSLDPVLVPYVSAWRRFLEESGAEVEHWERPVCDPVLGYAGTLDGIIRLPSARHVQWRTVLDIKTAVYPSVGPQIAAYVRCARALYDGPALFNRAALVIPGDGSYRLVHLIDREDEAVFLAALRLHHFRVKHGISTGR